MIWRYWMMHHSYRIWMHGDRLKWLIGLLKYWMFCYKWWMMIPIWNVYVWMLLFVWEWIEIIVIDCTPIPYSSTQTIQHISFYIQSLWFEYELYVISDNPSFNISCFHHSIWYTIHTLYQHLLFISTHSTIYTLSEGWMIRRETAWMSV